MGRNGMPIGLHLAKGNPNRLTKEQIKQRQEAEIKLGKSELDKLKPPPFVKNDLPAHACWKHYIKEYKEAAKQGIELVTTSDVGLLAMYCKTYAQYENLLHQQQKLEAPMEERLTIETAINKKMDMLLKMQDRLFLNPLAKLKHVLKPKEKEKPVSKFSKFGGA